MTETDGTSTAKTCLKAPPPTQEQVERFIRDVAAPMCGAEDLRGSSLEIGEDKITLKTPGWTEWYTRLSSGALQRATRSGPRPMVRGNLMDTGGARRLARIREKVLEQVLAFVDPPALRRGAPRGPQEPEQVQVEKLLNSRETRLAVERESRTAAALDAPEQLRGGRPALSIPGIREFLGEENVLRAERASGGQPGFYEFNRTALYADAVDQLMDSNPNAAVAWVRLSRDGSEARMQSMQAWALEAHARTAFTQEAMSAEIDAWMGPLSRGQLWEAFTLLDAETVRRHPESPGAWAMAGASSVRAGTSPSPELLEEMLGAGTKLAKIPPGMADAAVEESVREEAGQGLLAAQFRAAVRTGMKSRESLPDTAALGADWAEWMEACPKRVRDPAPPRARGKGGPGRAERSASELRRRARELADALGRGEMEEAGYILRNAVQVRSRPGPVRVLAASPEAPRGELTEALALEALPGGAVRLDARGMWTGPGSALSRQVNHTRRSHDLQTGRFALTTCLAALRALIARSTGSNGGEEPGNDVLARAAWDLLDSFRPCDRPASEDAWLSQAVQEGLAETLDEETAERARWGLTEGGGHRTAAPQEVTVSRYNLAAAQEIAQGLAETNPGALMWAYFHCGLDEELGHPGQVISMARRSMEDSGLPGRHWRYAAAIPTDTACLILENRNPAAAAIIMEGLARAGVPPAAAGPPGHGPAAAMVTKLTEAWGWDERTHRENTVLAVQLIYRELHRHRERYPEGEDSGEEEGEAGDRLRREHVDVADYVTQTSDRGERVRSTTWRGLVKASERWHRDFVLELNRARAVNAVRRKNGRVLAWNSLLGETELGELTATPLTDESQLAQEAWSMDHCVGGYGDPCARGSSRIFSIRRDRKRVATVEIRLQPDGTWEVAQTRSGRNRDAAVDAKEMARELAGRYSRLWKPGEKTHRSWETTTPREETAPEE